MSDYYDRFVQKVEDQNKINSIINSTGVKLKSVLTQFIGKQVIKADGELMKNFKTEIQKITSPLLVQAGSNMMQIRVTNTKWCLYLAGWTNNSAHVEIRIGKLNDGILESIMDDPALKDDYTVESVVQHLNNIESTNNLLSRLVNAMPEFTGENYTFRP